MGLTMKFDLHPIEIKINSQITSKPDEDAFSKINSVKVVFEFKRVNIGIVHDRLIPERSDKLISCNSWYFYN